jgi:hypothetical protein
VREEDAPCLFCPITKEPALQCVLFESKFKCRKRFCHRCATRFERHHTHLKLRDRFLCPCCQWTCGKFACTKLPKKFYQRRPDIERLLGHSLRTRKNRMPKSSVQRTQHRYETREALDSDWDTEDEQELEDGHEEEKDHEKEETTEAPEVKKRKVDFQDAFQSITPTEWMYIYHYPLHMLYQSHPFQS